MPVMNRSVSIFFFFFQAEDGIRDVAVTGVQTCALPIFPGQRDVARIELTGKNLSRPIAGELDVRSFVLGPNGALAALIATPARPGEILRLERGQVKQVTLTNDSVLAGLRLAGIAKTRFPSRDGTQIEGFVYTPPGFAGGPPAPALLRIHGGPVAQYTWAFNFEAQLLAARGYVVIHVNPRGSSGYGQDFCRAIWADWGNKDYDDVMAGGGDAGRRGDADPQRPGGGGWADGGIPPHYVITKTHRLPAPI